MNGVNPPRVFISYSWDSDYHKAWVRYLGEQLQQGGVNTRLDQWYVKAGDSFTKFMEEEVAAADYVLVVCTPAYAKKSNAREGGVGYEQQIVSGQLMSGIPRSKFVPILRSGTFEIGDNCAIPTHFVGIAVLDFRRISEFQERLEDLFRILFSRPKFMPPPLGKPPLLKSIQYTTFPSTENESTKTIKSKHISSTIKALNEQEILSEEEIKILKSHAGMKIGYGMTASEIEGSFGIHKVKAQYYFDQLEEKGYIKYVFDSDTKESAYQLTKAGRRYLVDHKLLDITNEST